MNKKKKVEKLDTKFKKIARKSINKKNYEKALASISSDAQLLYMFNQKYYDNDLENMLIEISDEIIDTIGIDYKKEDTHEDIVLFYDGFGLDTRGVAMMYLNALNKIGYKIIYVTDIAAYSKQPELHSKFSDSNIDWEYVSMQNSYIEWIKELVNVFCKYKPKYSMFYSTPYDVSGCIAFAFLKDIGNRFLIDLTDHAFWLGAKTNDYFLGSREMSASNQHYKRDIPREKIIKLGVNLVVNDFKTSAPLPFDVEKEKYIFSGGSLYKTLGDENNFYYKIIQNILHKHHDLLFLYAGEGDKTEMNKLIDEFPNRVYLISERKDFYYLIKHSLLYLNTYPMFGGMMMKYAAYAGKIPITLKHNSDSDGLLLNQKHANIEYDNISDLLCDVDKLLLDDEYRLSREKLLKGTIITEKRFVDNLNSALKKHCTDYDHEYIELDTTDFQKEFYERFDLREVKRAISKRINRVLIVNFRWMITVFLERILKMRG